MERPGSQMIWRFLGCDLRVCLKAAPVTEKGDQADAERLGCD